MKLFLCLFPLCAALAVSSYHLGYNRGLSNYVKIFQGLAVDAGVGEYRVTNPLTGETKFEWLPPSQARDPLRR